MLKLINDNGLKIASVIYLEVEHWFCIIRL